MQPLSNAEAITQKTYVDINTISGPIVPSYNCNITFKLNVCQLLKCLELISQSFWSISFKLFPDRRHQHQHTPHTRVHETHFEVAGQLKYLWLWFTSMQCRIERTSSAPTPLPPPQVRNHKLDNSRLIISHHHCSHCSLWRELGRKLHN